MEVQALVSTFDPDLGWSRVLETFREAAAGPVGETILSILAIAVPVTMLATLAGLVLGSWPRWGRAGRRKRKPIRPGRVACWASVASWPVAGAFAFGSGWLATEAVRDSWRPWSFAADAFATLGGFAVAVSWTTLALNRRWVAESSWADRLGRLVGLTWVVMLVLACYVLLGRPG